MVVAPRMSGSTAGTFGGGRGAGWPMMRSSTQVPRKTGGGGAVGGHLQNARDGENPSAVVLRRHAPFGMPPR